MRQLIWSACLAVALLGCSDGSPGVEPVETFPVDGSIDAGLWDADLDQQGDTALSPKDAEVDATPPEDDASAPYPDATVDLGPDAAVDLGIEADAGSPLTPEPGEHDVGFGWLTSSQPTEGRIESLVNMGARIISLRLESEESFDEAALIEALGGRFTRHPTRTADLGTPEYQDALFEIMSEHMDWGGPVYLHCASSARAGAAWALYHGLYRGVPADEAIEMGREAGLGGLEGLVRGLLGV